MAPGQTQEKDRAVRLARHGVKVRVVDVDIKRKRIGLTMRKHDGSAEGRPEQRADRPSSRAPTAKAPERSASPRPGKDAPQGALGAALAQAFNRK